MPHPSGLTYGEQIERAAKSARKRGDHEAAVYYGSLQEKDTSASASFEQFKGSAAYAFWREKPETKALIEQSKRRMPF